MFPFKNYFHPGEQKKVFQGKIGEEVHGGHAVSGEKLLNIQSSVRRCTSKSSIMKWANTGKSLQKNSLKPDTASHNSACWCTDTDGFLEHSPSGRSLYYNGPTLQKIILGFWGGPPLVLSIDKKDVDFD